MARKKWRQNRNYAHVHFRIQSDTKPFEYAACGRENFRIRKKIFAEKKNSGYVWTWPKAFRQGIELAWKPNVITTTQACARQNKLIFHWLLGNRWKTQLLGYCHTLLQENGLNTGVTYLDWKWSSSWVNRVQTRIVVGDKVNSTLTFTKPWFANFLHSSRLCLAQEYHYEIQLYLIS